MNSKISERIERYWKILLENLGEEVPLDTLASSNPEDKIGSDTVAKNLKDMKNGGRPGYTLTVGKKSATLRLAEDGSKLTQREKQNTEIKARLGRLIWHILFNTECPDHGNLTTDGDWTDLNKKIRFLRRKSPVIICSDAGSTCLKFIEALGKLKNVPIEVDNFLISPRIITNSPPIATAISNSKFRANIRVSMVGGDYRHDQGSICGSLTQLYLAHAKLAADVSVIGTTGVRQGPQGEYYFACEDLDESHLKSTFLGISPCKIICLDSSKLYYPDRGSVFARLDRGSLDLVVIDDGIEVGGEDIPDLKDYVSKFISEAATCGVAVAMLKTK